MSGLLAEDEEDEEELGFRRPEAKRLRTASSNATKTGGGAAPAVRRAKPMGQ